jgi:hypothetical protein
MKDDYGIHRYRSGWQWALSEGLIREDVKADVYVVGAGIFATAFSRLLKLTASHGVVRPPAVASLALSVFGPSALDCMDSILRAVEFITQLRSIPFRNSTNCYLTAGPPRSRNSDPSTCRVVGQQTAGRWCSCGVYAKAVLTGRLPPGWTAHAKRLAAYQYCGSYERHGRLGCFLTHCWLVRSRMCRCALPIAAIEVLELLDARRLASCAETGRTYYCPTNSQPSRSVITPAEGLHCLLRTVIR